MNHPDFFFFNFSTAKANILFSQPSGLQKKVKKELSKSLNFAIFYRIKGETYSFKIDALWYSRNGGQVEPKPR